MEFIENCKPSIAYEEKFYEYVLDNHREDLVQILKQSNYAAHYPLEIFFIQLQEKLSILAENIVDSPESVLPVLDRAAHRALANVYESLGDKSDFIFKKHIHVRFLSLLDGVGSYRTVFPGCKDVGQFMALVGTIVRTSQPNFLEYKRFYRCNKCRQIMVIEALAGRSYAFPRVDKCENLCVGAKIEPYEPGEGQKNGATAYARVKDYQEIKLQEQISTRTGFGTIPKALWVILEDDLVDSCKPGDDVVITGTLFLKWKLFRKDHPISTEVTFKANHVEVKNDQRASVQIGPETLKMFDEFWASYENKPFSGRNAILRSICPHVYGMYLVKLAIAVVLAGGVSKEIGGARVRGESHLLLIGDPGTGKSQILKYISRITPRSVFTTGAGTSNAGLTVAAVKDGGDWHLEAGALVLADSGVCCIDEFSHIKEHDRTSIHEAMEQQSISVAKAGMVCKLGTKCTVVAATNPKMNKYDPTESLELNVGLASPLLSRFDLIIALKDAQNDAWDEFLSDFILRDVDVFDFHAKNAQKSGIIWDNDTVQSYLVLIKGKVPEMTEDAHHVLSRYFQLQRNSVTRNAARTTVRLLESLYRLAEGHARLMYKDFVSIHDAVTAVSLVEASMQSAALGQTHNSLHIAFPEDPLEEYYTQAKAILQTLGLPELWEREKIYLENMKVLNSRKPSMPPPPPPQGPSREPQPHANASFIFQKPCSSSSSNNMDVDNVDSPNVIPETQYSYPLVTSTSSQSGISRQAGSGRCVSQKASQQSYSSRNWDSPELFPDNNDDVAIVDPVERGALTSTQNSTGKASYPIRNNEDAFDVDILSPIPQIENNVENICTVFRTPTQPPLQGVKRKRVSEESTELIKCTRSPPLSTTSTTTTTKSTSGSNGSGTFKYHSAYSNIQRYQRLPKSQD